MIRRPPRSTLDRSSAASDVYKRQDMWDTSTWRWHDLNEFYFTARDLSGNWNSANASMVYDPWAPSNSGPTPQLSFDSIRVQEWGDSYVPVNADIAYSFNVGEISITRLFDGKEICLTAYSSTGVQMHHECQIDLAPPWEETPGSNRPIMDCLLYTSPSPRARG